MNSMLLGSNEARLERVQANLEWEASLPPQTPEEREMAIYEAVYVDFQKPWKVARDYKLSPATVENIARQTRDRLARREHEFYQLRKMDALGERHAQYRSMLLELKDAWKESLQGRCTLHVKGVQGPMRETIRNRGLGDVRYMNLIFKIRKELDAIEDRMGGEEPSRKPRAASRERQRPEFAAPVAAPLAETPVADARGSQPEARGSQRKRQSRRAKHLAERAAAERSDMLTALPEGVSTGSEELDRQLLALLQGLPFPAEPCGCGSEEEK